jgi:hypothetical protein
MADQNQNKKETHAARRKFTYAKTMATPNKRGTDGPSSGDKVVLKRSSKDAFQWYPSQREKPEEITYTEVVYVETSKRHSGISVLKEGTETAIWVGLTEVGRYDDENLLTAQGDPVVIL